jgi:ADP-heptose:LPS heptosyltransferase
MITAINVTPRLFGGPLKAGDLLAACNFLEFIRLDSNQPDLKLYIPDASVHPQEHCLQMRTWLYTYTNYVVKFPDQLIDLKVIPGTDPVQSDIYNLWNIRKDVLYRRQNVFDIEDAIKIRNTREQKFGKIVIAPLMDAGYNFERNWSLEYLQNLVDTRYEACNNILSSWSFEGIIASKDVIPGLNIKGFKYSHDFIDNLNHIMECRHYVGGDTGMSHFAGSLDKGPYVEYHYSINTYGATNPLNWKKATSAVIGQDPMVYY